MTNGPRSVELSCRAHNRTVYSYGSSGEFRHLRGSTCDSDSFFCSTEQRLDRETAWLVLQRVPVEPTPNNSSRTLSGAYLESALSVADELIRQLLEALCKQQGISLDSEAVPGEPARNYELALRLGLGNVFGVSDIPKGGDDAETDPDSGAGSGS